MLTFINLGQIHKQYGPEAGLARLKAKEFWAVEPPSAAKLESLFSYIPDIRMIERKEGTDSENDDELPPSAICGVEYTTFNFNCPKFIKFLKEYLSGQGATFIKRKVSSIDEAFEVALKAMASPDEPNNDENVVLFNCTGIGAQKLGGVEDADVYPTRGQVVVVRAPHINENRALWGANFATYVIPRPYSFVNSSPEEKSSTTGKEGNVGHVVLGGYLQAGNYTGDTFGHETFNILDRTTSLYPEILHTGKFDEFGKPILKSLKDLEIVREAAGLRPSRKGGVRIELENYKTKDNKTRVVIHNYGAGGTGYQAGYGMALESIDLYKKYLKEKEVKSRL